MTLDRYVFGGYLVTQRVRRKPDMSAALLPDTIVSASACLARFVPDTWALAWTGDDSTEPARELGLAAAAITAYCTAAFDAGDFALPNIILRRSAVDALVEQLPPRAWLVLALGLHERHVESFLADAAPQTANADPGGVFRALSRREPVIEHTLLGFEPLVFAHGSAHSWLCNGLEVDCADKLAIAPNSHGLVPDAEAAERAVAYINAPEVGAEPGLWLPWALFA